MAQIAATRPNSRNRQAEKPRDAAKTEPRAWQPALIVFAIGLAGSLLLWAAFPPLDLPWLAWFAPLPWLWLVLLPELPGKRPYVMIWLAGCVHWLMMEYGIRMAHPALNAGWIALAAYLAVYLPLFIGLTRVAVHRLRISIVVAAPVVWVGLELLRGHFLGGFSMGLLAHTQAEFPLLIQISDLAGGYTLSFVIMLVAACLARMIPLRGAGVSPARVTSSDLQLTKKWPLAPAIAAIVLTLAYGQWRLSQTPPGHSGSAAKIALIQGSLDTVLDVTNERRRETLDQYSDLTRQAAQQRDLDLVVWPESMFVLGEYQLEAGAKPPPGFAGPPEEFPRMVASLQSDFQVVLANMAARANSSTEPGDTTQLLVGGNTIVYGPSRPRVFNAALLADRDGNIVGRYYKTQAVMFGEYIPVVDWFPAFYDWMPISGMSVGQGPRVFDIAGLRMSPSICFESTVPHLIRGQVVELARQGKPADVLVNLTNDGWFWGSSMLDQHLRCGVFRAVENRKPLVVAANTGISAAIDGNGTIRDRGAKRKLKVIITELQPDGRASLYHWLGDWPASLMALACFGLAMVGAQTLRVRHR